MDDGDGGRGDWRTACWIAPSRAKVEAALTRKPEADIWIACGRSVAVVMVAADRRAAVEAELGRTGLCRRQADGRLALVYAAAGPIVCHRSPDIEVFGLASRVIAYRRDDGHSGDGGWLEGGPDRIPVSRLPAISNAEIRRLFERPDDLGAVSASSAMALRIDRSYLVDWLSSRSWLASQLALRLRKGRSQTRAISIGRLAPSIPATSRGLVTAPVSTSEANPGPGLPSGPAQAAPGAGFFADLAPQVAANGYSVVPVIARGKKLLERSHWRAGCCDIASADDVQRIAGSHPGAGVGLGCGSFVAAVDIDARVPERADAMEAVAREALGDTPLLRMGRWPRRVLLYRCREPVVTVRWQDLEVLGLGCHVLAYGIHPRTGKPYTWGAAGEPARTPIAELPCIGNEDVERFMRGAIARFGGSDEPVFGLDPRNFTPIVSSLGSLARLLLGSLVRNRAQRRAAAARLIAGRYYNTGTGLAIEWLPADSAG